MKLRLTFPKTVLTFDPPRRLRRGKAPWKVEYMRDGTGNWRVKQWIEGPMYDRVVFVDRPLVCRPGVTPASLKGRAKRGHTRYMEAQHYLGDVRVD